jgi:hypothetical protein
MAGGLVAILTTNLLTSLLIKVLFFHDSSIGMLPSHSDPDSSNFSAIMSIFFDGNFDADRGVPKRIPSRKKIKAGRASTSRNFASSLPHLPDSSALAKTMGDVS